MPLSLTTDSLSPMLVKELRQGLKSKSFYFAFLLMQGLMFFCVLMFATAMEARSNPEFVNVMFWFCLGGPLILITPLRALGALQQEIKGNTLELIFLTRLSAWRIIAGKWLALFSQSLLLTVATVPYLFLRYFMGGINVSDDLQAVFWLLVSSAGLTALGVCFSAFRAQWIRVVIVILAFLSPNLILGVFFARSMGGGGSISSGATHPVLYGMTIAAIIVVGIVLALFWGASRIAPPAENYSRWKRLLTLALLALVPVLMWTSGEKETVFFALVIIIPMCLDALGEQPLFFPSVYMPFVRHGALGRLAGAVFTPGWPSGIFFTLLCCAGFAVMVYLADLTGSSGSTIMGMAAALPGTLLFPVALVLMIRPKATNIFAGMLGIQVASIILAIIAIAIHETWHSFEIGFLHLIPPCSFVLHIGQQHDDDAWAFVNLIISAMALVFLVARTRPVAGAIRKQAQMAVQLLAAQKAQATQAVAAEKGP